MLLARAAAEGVAGRLSQAHSTLKMAAAITPEDPRLLNALGNRLLSLGAPNDARAQFERAIAADPNAAPLRLNLALAARLAGDDASELKALDAALRIDPYFTFALLQRAQLLERLGERHGAAQSYAALIACAPPDPELPPATLVALDHARSFVAVHREELQARLRSVTMATGAGSPRFEHCLDLFSGKSQLYFPQPAGGLHFPFLPAVPFFAESMFPWFTLLEAATDVIREEYLSAMAARAALRPYVDIPPGAPVNQWTALNRSLDWSALFLWENGRRNEANAASCPRTIKLLESLPLLDVPQHAPTFMFSILKPGAVIPPHHGVTNTRAVIHLPIIVPPGCGFRVGSEKREWREGVAWAFDDTIEHEAWNRSDRPRAILIVDAWNPYLDEDERRLVRAATAVVGARIAV